MEFPPDLAPVTGAKELFDWFGFWPSFHDAEVLWLHLNRGDVCRLAIHTWDMTAETDEKGYYVLAKHIVVEFVMSEVVDLQSDEFNRQNVISSLTIRKIQNGYRLILGGCYGLAGTIDAADLSIWQIPGKPSSAVIEKDVTRRGPKH